MRKTIASIALLAGVLGGTNASAATKDAAVFRDSHVAFVELEGPRSAPGENPVIGMEFTFTLSLDGDLGGVAGKATTSAKIYSPHMGGCSGIRGSLDISVSMQYAQLKLDTQMPPIEVGSADNEDGCTGCTYSETQVTDHSGPFGIEESWDSDHRAVATNFECYYLGEWHPEVAPPIVLEGGCSAYYEHYTFGGDLMGDCSPIPPGHCCNTVVGVSPRRLAEEVLLRQ